ncbi:hypothetical protein Tco_1142590 [Tanacetum coccineum]
MVTPDNQRVNRYILGLAPKIKAHVTLSKPTSIQSAVSMANCLTMMVLRMGYLRKRKMLGTRRGRMIKTGTEEGMIGIKDKELEGTLL